MKELMMSRLPSAKVIKITVFVLLPLALLGYWFWTIQRNWSFVGAAERGDIGKVRIGLDGGIDPNKANMLGATALCVVTNSSRPGQDAIIRLLLDRGANPNDGIYHAAAGRSPDIVRLLLDRGANPTSGLCSAVEAKRPDIVQLLIERGANVNTDCSDTEAPVLLTAAEFGSNEIVRLLKDAGAKK